jgi:hypothetical protein
MPTFNTTDPKPGYVYDSATDTWFPLVGIAPASQVDRWTKTAAGGETSLSGNDDNAVSLSYTAGTEQVYLNGVLLVRGQDYTATNGTTITALTALAASDVAEVVTFNPSNIITTDAVIATDFEAKGDIISASAASTPIRLPVGTTGQVLKANSATTSGLEWGSIDADIEGVTAGTGLTGGGTSGTVTLALDSAAVIAPSIVDAKGDIIAATADNTPSRLASSAVNDQVLTVDTSTATGLKWATPAAGGYTTISSGNLSGSSTVTISSIPATYRSIVLVILNPTTASGSQYIQSRINGNTADYALSKFNSNNTSITSQGATTFWYLDNQDQTIPTSANGTSYVLTLNEYATAGIYKSMLLNNYVQGASGNAQFGLASNRTNTNAITSFSILTSGAANFSGGTYTLYGVK